MGQRGRLRTVRTGDAAGLRERNLGHRLGDAAGNYYSCAVQSGTGAVVCWGDNASGQATPPAYGTSGSASAIAAGFSHTLAIAVPEPGIGIALASGIALLAALNSRKKNQLPH